MRLLLILIPALLAAQSQHNLTLTPIGSTVGGVEFRELFTNGQNGARLKAPDALTSSYTLTLPASPPATSGDCLTGSTSGVLSFGSCGGSGSGNWIGSGFSSIHTDGAVIIRNGNGASTLASNINASTTSIPVADAASFVNNRHIKIGNEVMLVTAIDTGTDILTVTRGVNYSTAASHTAGAEVGSAGFLQIEQTTGTYPYRLGNGMWYTGAVAYFRPTAAGNGILDVSSNGFADAWIDVCGTDVETGIAAFECLELRSNRSEDGGTTYGHVGMKAFGSGVAVRDLAINENGAQVTIGGNTFSNNLRVQASASDAKGITIFGTAAPGLEIQNGTEAVYVGLSTGVNKYFPDSVLGNLALRSANGIGFTADAGTTTHLRISGGASRFNTHITTGSASAFDIGDATNYFQTLFIENIEGAPAGLTTNYAKFRRLEVADNAGGTSFWLHSAQASGAANSSYTIRDNAGSRWLAASRAVSSSPTNSTQVFTAWVPALRATADGDAVNDATLPALGSSGSRWSTTWTTGLNASGTITFPTGAAAGRVWTSDGSGNGAWATPSTSQWITTGSDIYYSAGRVGIGTTTPDQALDVQGVARVWSGNITGDTSFFFGNADEVPGAGAIMSFIGSATPPRFELNAITQGVAYRDLAFANLGGNVCVGCTTPTTKLDVGGTFRATGTSTFGGALIASATDTHDIGSSTRFRNIFGQTVNTAGLEVANGTTVTTFWRHTLNSASAYDILSGSGSQLEMRLETLSSTNSGAGFRGTLYPLSTSGSNGDLGYSGTPWRSLFLSTGFRLTAGAAAGRVLTSDASGNGTWVAPSSGGSVTSIATTSPISGGTITATGTISCSTCVTTDTTQTITAVKTFSSSIAAGSTDTHDIGSSTRFRNIFGQTVNAAGLEIANGTFTGTFWRHNLNSASAYDISSGSASQLELRLETFGSTNSGAGFRGTLYPLNTSGSNGDLGYSGTPFRSLFLSSTATIGGAITANGGIATASGTNSTIYVGSGNLYLRTFSGGDASCSGVTNGWVGYRTDTNELQVCNGGSVRKVSLL